MNLESSAEAELVFSYQLSFEDGKTLVFPIHIDKASNDFILQNQLEAPAWTALEYHQCSNCPLSKVETPVCPVAINLVPLIDLCGAMISYQSVQVEVVTPERVVSCQTTVQRVVSSILGLIIATSSCPHTEYFKPMARFHLPLSTEDETIYRATSMFLLAQYLLHKDGKPFSQELEGLKDIYKELQVVNRALAKRVKAAISKDAAVNGIILLDLLTQSVSWSIEDGLDHLQYLFKRYGEQ